MSFFTDSSALTYVGRVIRKLVSMLQSELNAYVRNTCISEEILGGICGESNGEISEGTVANVSEGFFVCLYLCVSEGIPERTFVD